MDQAPEIVAVSAARKVTDHARAIENLSDEQPMRERVAFTLVNIVVISAILFFLYRVGGVAEWNPYFAAAIIFACTTPIALYMEIHWLKRRVKAITHLLLEHERKV